jgi:glutaconate CoA-transferase subunit B
MTVTSLHPGVSAEAVRDSMAWEPAGLESAAVTEAPSAEELRLIREELDPARNYTG